MLLLVGSLGPFPWKVILSRPGEELPEPLENIREAVFSRPIDIAFEIICATNDRHRGDDRYIPGRWQYSIMRRR